MTGTLNMGSNKVQSTAVPTLAQDLCNKTYVDSQVGGITSGITQAAADARYYLNTTPLNSITAPTNSVSMNG